MTAGEAEDFGDDTSVILEGKFEVWMEQEIFGFVGFAGGHYDTIKLNNLISPSYP
jgi:hypothetical protein